MPELPEVETVRRSLSELVVGKTVHDVEVRLPRLIRSPDSPQQFEAMLVGRRIVAVRRRGKYLLIDMPPLTLISHLRMEGQYSFAESAATPELSHTHVFFTFTDGTQLRYRDVRQFGTMDLVLEGNALPKGLLTLGPEPFDAELTSLRFYRRIHPRSAPMKSVLLDQTVIAGLGNIYVDEALFWAGIHPTMPADKVGKADAGRLLEAIREVLSRAIEAGGSSIKTYVNGYGRHGGFQIQLAAYGRAGQPCPRCHTVIEKMRVAGRGTHVCPVCQKPPRNRAQSRPKRTGELA